MLSGVSLEQLANLRITYEPVWAIGENGIPATAEYADQKHFAIKQCLMELFDDVGNNITVFYGGSVSLENSDELLHSHVLMAYLLVVVLGMLQVSLILSIESLTKRVRRKQCQIKD